MSAATIPHLGAVQAHGLRHGLPNWADLHTARAGETTAFYEGVLGWGFHRRPILAALPDPVDDRDAPAGPVEPGAPVGEESALLAGIGAGPVAEIVARGDCFEVKHLLSTWFPYVQVHDLDAVIQLVEPAGGLVLSPPAIRGDEARVATILDPSDALLRIWQPSPLAATPVLHEPGALTWIELETNDLDRSRRFYRGLFGWLADEVTTADDEPYLIFRCGGDPVAGAVWSPLAEIPASWCTAFAVPDADEATARAVEAGAVLMTEPTEMNVGRQSILVDPTGAVFGLLGPATSGPRPL